MDDSRTWDGINLKAFEIALKHLNQIAGGVFGSDVVDPKSKNNLQDPKSRANPNAFRAAETTFQAAGIKFQDFGLTFQRALEWKLKLGMKQPLMDN
jgi:hypothetical protein